MVHFSVSALLAALLSRQSVTPASAVRGESIKQPCVLPPSDARFEDEHLGTTGLMRYVKSRADLPTYTSTTKIELHWIESIVSSATGWTATVIMGLLQQYHSAIKGKVLFDDGTEKTFVLELWGMGNSTVAPYCLDEDGPKWQHNTVVVFTDGHDQSKWFGPKKHGFPIAHINGDSANRLFDYAYQQWANNEKRRTYVQWQWWPTLEPGDAIKHRNMDLICDSFTEALYWKIPEFGGTLIADIPRLRRNYGIVTSESAPEVVERNDARIIDFYEKVLKNDQMAFLSPYVHPVAIWDQVQDKYFFFERAKVNVKYDYMPLPPLFYSMCNRVTSECSQTCHGFRGATCVAGRCTCTEPACAFQGEVFGNYCMGPEWKGSWHHYVTDDDMTYIHGAED